MRRRLTEEALLAWLVCLGTGDLMAHFGVGYTSFALGKYHDAYRHLRYYVPLATHDAWSWCWYGRAALAVGESAEGMAALRRAVELEAMTSVETDAAEMLKYLG